MRIFIIFTFIFAGIHSYAGQEVGNGGDVIYCHTSYYEKNTVELLDYYEARVMRGINIDLGAPSMPYLEKVRMAILRLEILSPERAQRYQQQADTFLSETLFLKKHELVDIPDSANVALPEGCEIMQIVVQKAPQFPEDKRYVINQDLWDLLDEDSRAGLILHELIYREAVEEFRHQTSISSRYFNSYLAADKFKNMTQEMFFGFLSRVKFLKDPGSEPEL